MKVECEGDVILYFGKYGMMSHTSIVYGNVNSYRNVPDNVNCVWLANFTTVNSVYCAAYLCQLNYMLYSCWDAPDNLTFSSKFFLNLRSMFLDGVMLQ
jgi:hypothetical protein